MLTATLPTTSYLKYPGGKRRLVPSIAHFYEAHRHVRFVDLFCGSAGVTLGLRPDEALLNDVNEHVVNLHQWVRRGWGWSECCALGNGVEFRNDREVYGKNRDRFNQLIKQQQHQTLESAMLLYYLNRTGFNGLIRFNLSGFHNASFGSYRTINYLENFQPWNQAFSGWEFSSVDFAAVELRPTDFVYADPPYDSVKEKKDPDQLSLFGAEDQGETGNGFVGYSGAFGWDQQVDLAVRLAQHPGPCLVSNAATPRIQELYYGLGFQSVLLNVRRSISANGDRPMAQEIFAFKEGTFLV